MKREERTEDPTIAFIQAFAGQQTGIWTALPGEIEAYDPSKQTASVKPCMQAEVTDESGATTFVKLPLLVDCPVIFPSGGGYTLTFPVKAGDECLVVFASRCIDGWWQSSGQAVPPEFRMHDLSDGFVLVGARSQPKLMPTAPSTDGVELRNDARTAFVKIDDAANVQVSASGNIQAFAAGNLAASALGAASVSAPSISLTGNVTITGNLTVNGNTSLVGTAVANGKNIGSTHTHSGVQTGSGSTGVPN
jgi:phage baseplate assembly protein gpV